MRDVANETTEVSKTAINIHTQAIEAVRTGNRGRLALCDALRQLAETRLYFELGFPSVAAYASDQLHLRRSESYELLRVGKTLEELTLLRDAFARGAMSWSALKAISRVASVDSQQRWLDFARDNTAERTIAEATDALRNNRDAPRVETFGLPNLAQKLVFRLSRTEAEQVRRILEAAATEIQGRTGSDEVTLEQSLLFLCQSVGGSKTIAADKQLVYQCCPDCRKARTKTREGHVVVDEAELDRVMGEASTVVIDAPTSKAVRRKVLARECGECGNPRCSHQADHSHHIKFRSRGGMSTVENQVAVCATCHALVHAGLLRVEGDANDALTWSPVVRRVQVVEMPSIDIAIGSSGSPESADADSAQSHVREIADGRPRPRARCVDVEAIAIGLVQLGIDKKSARRRVEQACLSLPDAMLSDAVVLREALRMRS